MSLSSELLDILVCPESKQPLIYFEEEEFLFCPESRLKYPITEGIPQMLTEEAEEVSEEEAQQLKERAEQENLRWTAQETAETEG